MNIRKRHAFTLVELLVVIAIIGLLSTIAIVATGAARDKARTAKVNADFQQIFKQIEVARNNYNLPLISISGGCSDCNCRIGSDISVLPSSHACVAGMQAFFNAIGTPVLPRDPWGSPYLMDENEMESGGCSPDRLSSAGPNKVDEGGGGDDIVFNVPYFQCL
jgi:prepilin-type N-terminal cleavage/methylation domain-containing protein